jgi:hypothetical protein
MARPDIHRARPWWAIIDTALLLALLALFAKTASWQGEVDQWRQATQEQIQKLAGQNITPGASREIGILDARLTAAEDAQREMKIDLAARMDRQDKKLDAIADKLDRLAR